MKRIPVGKYFALVDDEDYERVAKYKWSAYISTRTVYAHRNFWINGKYTNVRMHRFILNAPKGTPVDHKNGEGLDNRRSNLRYCSLSQNQGNRRLQKNNTSGYRGVSFKKDCPLRPWRVEFQFQNNVIHVGQFATKEEAACAYNAKAKELFGDFARLNPV